MKGLGKKIVALAAVATMAMTALTGCAESSIDNSEIAAVVGENKITAGVANFYLRYQQVAVESIYKQMVGEDLWITEIEEGETYEDLVKDDAMESLVELYILKDRMADYNVTLTDEDKEAIETAAKAFVKANKEEALEKISGELDIIKEVMELITINEKMHAVIEAEADREVSDDEAKLKKMTYVQIKTTATSDDGATINMSEDEIADAKKEAEDILENAKAAGDLLAYAETVEKEATELAFNSESTAIAEEAIATADALGEGEFAELVEAEDGFYVIQLTSLFDQEATDAKKKEILEAEKSEYYTKVYEAWREEAEVEMKEKVLDKISFQRLEIIVPAEG